MKLIVELIIAGVLAGCGPVTITTSSSVSEEEFEQFLRKHRVGRSHAAALKKNSLGVVSYLATVHGYPNNLSVCNEIIAPYNKDASLSSIPGAYFCEELR